MMLMASGSIVFIEPAPYDLLAIALFLWCSAAGLRYPRQLHLPILLLGLFLLGNLLAAALAPDPLQSIRSLSIRIYMVLTWLLLAALIAMEPERMLRWLWRGYLIAAVIAVSWGALGYLGFLPASELTGGGRAQGAFKDPNVYGPFLVPALLHCVRRVTQGPLGIAGFFVALSLLLGFGVLLSFSRGAWINAATALSLYLFCSFVTARSFRRQLAGILGAVTLIAALAGVLAAAVSFDVIGDRFFQRAVLTQKYDVQTGGRFDTQTRTFAHIGKDPIGIGPGRSDEVFGLEPHNLYLHVLVEAGWLGGLAWIAFLLVTAWGLTGVVRRPGPLRDEGFLVSAALMGLLLQALFIDATHWRHLWLLLAIAWALILATRGQQNVRPDIPVMSKSSAARGAKGYS